MNNLPLYLTGTLAVAILGLSKGGFAGVGMISTPLLALAVGPVEAAGILLPVLVVQDFIAVWFYRRAWNKRLVANMIPGAVLGIVLAYELAATVPESAVELVLGVISLLFSTGQLMRHFMKLTPTKPALPRTGLGVACGIASGFTSTIAHAGTPPFQFYVMPQRLGRDEYVGTSVVFFAALNAMKIPAFAALGQISSAHLMAALVFIPVAILTSWLGVRMVRKVDVQRFNLIIMIILAGVSVALIYEGIEA